MGSLTKRQNGTTALTIQRLECVTSTDRFGGYVTWCDCRCDIYSLGVILWEMVTGQRPWAGKSHVAIACAVTLQVSVRGNHTTLHCHAASHTSHSARALCHTATLRHAHLTLYVCPMSHCHAASHIPQGHRLSKPTDPARCPPELWDLMSSCWASRPFDRPSAQQVSEPRILDRWIDGSRDVATCGVWCMVFIALT